MRIIFWSSTFWPHIGGVEVLGTRLVGALRDRGHEVVVLARRDTPDLPAADQHAGVRIVRHPFRQALERADMGQVATGRRLLARLVAEVEPDVLHVFHPGPDLLYRSALGRLPMVVSLHQSYPDIVLEQEDGAVVRTLREAASIIPCSAAVERDLLAARPELAGKATTLPNRIPASRVAGSPLPENPVVLFVGRAVPQKGFDLGLRAFRRVLDRVPVARLVVAGDGPERRRLVDQARTLGLDGAVDFRGWVLPDEVPHTINESTVVAMPSRFEPFGLVALQAAQLGRPVVGFAVDGLAEAVADGETGLLVEPGDVAGLGAALVDLLTDPARAASLGEAGSKRFGPEEWPAYVSAHEALYAQALRR